MYIFFIRYLILLQNRTSTLSYIDLLYYIFFFQKNFIELT